MSKPRTARWTIRAAAKAEDKHPQVVRSTDSWVDELGEALPNGTSPVKVQDPLPNQSLNNGDNK